MIATLDSIIIGITFFMGIITAAAFIGIAAGNVTSLRLPKIRRRNRRKFGTVPKDDRGAWMRTLSTMQQQQLIHAAHVEGWKTRRRNERESIRRNMGRDIADLIGVGDNASNDALATSR